MSSYTFGGRSGPNATAANITLVPGSIIPIGALFVVRASTNGASSFTVSDNAGGNTYTQRALLNVGGQTIAIFESVLATAFTAATTLTVTPGTSGRLAIDCLWATNPAASPFDFALTGSGTSTAVATSTPTATGTPATTDSIAVFAEVDAGSAATATPQASWTEDSDVTANLQHFETQTRILTTTTAIGGSATIASSVAYSCAMVVYKLTSATPSDHNLGLLGVGA